MSAALLRRVFYSFFGLLLLAVFSLVSIESKMPLFFQGSQNQAANILADNLTTAALSRRYIMAITDTNSNNKALNSDSTQTNLAAFSALLSNKLQQVTGIENAWLSQQPPIDLPQILGTYAQHAESIFSLNPKQDAAQLFVAEQLPQRAAMLKQLLMSPQAHLIKSIARHDPLLLTLYGFKSWRERMQPVSTQQQQVAYLFLQSKPDAFDVDAQSALQANIQQQFAILNQQHQHRFSYQITGVPLFAVTAQTDIKADIQRVTLLSSISVALAFLFLFRSFKAMHWTALILMCSMGTGALITTLIFGYTHGLTLALGATLIGVCIDYPIHTMVHQSALNANSTKPAPINQALRTIWPSLLLGGITTIIGYLALAFSGYPGFQQIAVFAMSGISCALLLTRYCLPALLEHTQLKQPRLSLLKHWLLFCHQYRAALCVLIAILISLSLFVIPRLSWLDDLEKLSGSSLNQLKLKDKQIRAGLSTIEAGRVIMIQADDLETVLQTGEQVSRVLETLKQSATLTDYYAPTPLLISQQLQQHNREVYQLFVSKEFEQHWQTALKSQGLSISKLGQIYNKAATQKPALDNQQILTSTATSIIPGQLIQRDQHYYLIIWLAAHQPDIVRNALQQIDGVEYISQRDTINAMAQQYRNSATHALLIGLLSILMVLLLRFGDIRPAFTTLLPALCAIIVIFGVWGLLQQQISFLHLIGALLAVAICVDYGIFYAENRAQHPELTYQAMGASMLTTVLAFAALSISNNPLMQTLSVAVTSGVTIGFLLCPIMIKPANKTCQ